ILNPTIDLQVRDVRNIPYDREELPIPNLMANGKRLVELSKMDWDGIELSLDFASVPYAFNGGAEGLKADWCSWAVKMENNFKLVKEIEEDNNRLLIKAYDLDSDVAPEISEEQVTVTRPDREEDMERLISYSIGCMM